MKDKYRKTSAGALEINLDIYSVGMVKHPNKMFLWYPDVDANQREMIEDWLIKQGCAVSWDTTQKEALINIYHNIKVKHGMNSLRIIAHTDKSKSIAFMKAFMEYINK